MFLCYDFKQVQGFPKSIGTRRELCEILSRFLSHVTIYHAAVNYVVVDYGQYIPNQPTKLYNDSRVEMGEFSVYRLPNRLTTAVSGILLIKHCYFHYFNIERWLDKNALYLSINVFSAKVLFGDTIIYVSNWRCDRHLT